MVPPSTPQPAVLFDGTSYPAMQQGDILPESPADARGLGPRLTNEAERDVTQSSHHAPALAPGQCLVPQVNTFPPMVVVTSTETLREAQCNVQESPEAVLARNRQTERVFEADIRKRKHAKAYVDQRIGKPINAANVSNRYMRTPPVEGRPLLPTEAERLVLVPNRFFTHKILRQQKKLSWWLSNIEQINLPIPGTGGYEKFRGVQCPPRRLSPELPDPTPLSESASMKIWKKDLRDHQELMVHWWNKVRGEFLQDEIHKEEAKLKRRQSQRKRRCVSTKTAGTGAARHTVRSTAHGVSKHGCFRRTTEDSELARSLKSQGGLSTLAPCPSPSTPVSSRSSLAPPSTGVASNRSSSSGRDWRGVDIYPGGTPEHVRRLRERFDPSGSSCDDNFQDSSEHDSPPESLLVERSVGGAFMSQNAARPQSYDPRLSGHSSVNLFGQERTQAQVSAISPRTRPGEIGSGSEPLVVEKNVDDEISDEWVDEDEDDDDEMEGDVESEEEEENVVKTVAEYAAEDLYSTSP